MSPGQPKLIPVYYAAVLAIHRYSRHGIIVCRYWVDGHSIWKHVLTFCFRYSIMLREWYGYAWKNESIYSLFQNKSQQAIWECGHYIGYYEHIINQANIMFQPNQSPSPNDICVIPILRKTSLPQRKMEIHKLLISLKMSRQPDIQSSCKHTSCDINNRCNFHDG